MCLSTVYLLRQGEKELVQSEVAGMERHGDGYALYGILGGRHFVKGEIVGVDFIETNEVLMEQDQGEAE
jgi:predicted RNA-binding protein